MSDAKSKKNNLVDLTSAVMRESNNIHFEIVYPEIITFIKDIFFYAIEDLYLLSFKRIMP